MKLIIFDIDGTLTQTNTVDTLCFTEALATFFDTSDFDTDWKNYKHVSDSGITKEIAKRLWGRSLTAEESSQLEELFISILSAHPANSFAPILGAERFIELLKKTETYQIALATGCWKSSAIHKLEKAKIDHTNVPLATSSDSPDRANIMKEARIRAINHYGLEVIEETLYFGDAVWDVRACGNLNWRMIGIGENINTLKKIRPISVFEDYTQPREIIETIDAEPDGAGNGR
ncbi:MAG: HAD family hydrolase [Verrucomicrobiota bacterium]